MDIGYIVYCLVMNWISVKNHLASNGITNATLLFTAAQRKGNLVSNPVKLSVGEFVSLQIV